MVCFITTNDITGGNSGSPVMDANGNLLGLAFDGNYEALSHKIAFDKDLNRTICVDIRYVLWCIDKLGGAKTYQRIETRKINSVDAFIKAILLALGFRMALSFSSISLTL